MLITLVKYSIVLFLRWNITELKLGAISQPYKVGLEIVVPKNATFSIDNIRLDDCFPGNNNNNENTYTFII